MSKAPLRLVFDTNAFTPQHFQLLQRSPLIQLCASGRIVPLYGNVFLEEMWRAYESENRRTLLVEQWLPFILATVQRFPDDLEAILHRELVQGRGGKTNIYMSPRDQRRLVRGLHHVPLDGNWEAWHRAQPQLVEEEAKRARQREISKEIRQEVAETLKAIGYSKQQHGGPAPFKDYFLSAADENGRAFLPSMVICRDAAAVANRWARDKAAYPYFTEFVRSMAYMSYYAATRSNDKIDLNAQADLNLMIHLLHADGIVSNETGFLRNAFDDLWKPRGKVIFNSAEFCDFAKSLV